MSSAAIVSISLVVLFLAALPVWKHSRIWGGGYTPCVFLACMMAAHIYTVFFVK